MVADCSRPPAKRGYCGAHHQRVLKGHDLSKPLRARRRPVDIPTTCTHPGCAEPHYGSDLCRKHYGRRYNGRPLDDVRPYEPRIPGVTIRRTKAGYTQT